MHGAPMCQQSQQVGAVAARLLAEDCPLPPLPAVWCCLRS
eukprot:COSAG01_NODE_31374_length_598_cov_53.494990_1_plen_39_part_01